MARFELAVGELVEGAAQGGATDALFELGLINCSGRDGEVNLVEAHKWFNLAAMRGNEAARSYRLEIAAELTKAEVAKAQRLAREWLGRH